MPGAGALDRRITIEMVTDPDVPVGEETWTERATVWAGKGEIRGRERFTAQQDLATRTAIWTIRYRADVTETDRIVDDQGVTWGITGLAERGRREWLEISAEARNP